MRCAPHDLGQHAWGTPLATATHPALGWFLLAASLIPFGDALIVLRHHGSKVLAYAMHGGTGVLALVIAALQFLS